LYGFLLVAIKSPLGLIICAEKTTGHVELCKPAGFVIKAEKVKEKNEKKKQFELFFLGCRLRIIVGFFFLFIGHGLVRLLTL
jgi:hypothetical protein